MTQKIAIIGLGSMGFGMAKSILAAGHHAYGFDVNSEAVGRFVALGGQTGQVSEMAPAMDCVMVVVLNATQTETVLFGDGTNAGAGTAWAQHLRPGTTIISCATVPPDFARTMAAKAADLGLNYLDAPISGGSIKAEAGRLSVLASGAEVAFKKAKPALDAVAEHVFALGSEVGAGSAMKSINQILCGVHIAAMAEAMTFGMTQGVSPAQTLEVISKCAGTSWMFENRGAHVVAGDYKPHSSVNIWLKDLGIALDIAGKAKFSAPLTAVALQQFVAASGSGYGLEDDAAVAKIYARNGGLKLPGEG